MKKRPRGCPYERGSEMETEEVMSYSGSLKAILVERASACRWVRRGSSELLLRMYPFLSGLACASPVWLETHGCLM